MQKQEPVHTAIAVFWPDALAGDTQKVCAQQLESYAARLLDGLDLPGKLTIDWNRAENGRVGMHINGTAARLPYKLSIGAFPQAADLAGALCESLLANRALLVTAQLAQALPQLKNRYFLHFSIEDKMRALRRLFQLGFGLERLRRQDVESESSEPSPEEWAEAYCADLDDTSLSFYARREQIDPDDDPNDMNRLIEGAPHLLSAFFQIKGIPTPGIQGMVQDDLASGDAYFRINDLYLPVFTLASPPFEQFMRVLNQYGHLFINAGMVDFLLDSLEPTQPNLLAIARARFKNAFIANVLRGLAEENISIRSLAHILEILICAQDTFEQAPNDQANPPLSENTFFIRNAEQFTGQDPADWVELIRLNLKNAIINRALLFFEYGMTMSCFYLSDELAELLDGSGVPESVQEPVFAALHQDQITAYGRRQRPLVVQASMRRTAREWLRFEFPDMPVFSYQECWPTIHAQKEIPLWGN